MQKLIERATSGKKLDQNRVFRPSWFYSLIEESFWLWCEYYAMSKARFDETTVFNRHRMRLGNDWEERYVSNSFPTTYAIQSRWGEAALRDTLDATDGQHILAFVGPREIYCYDLRSALVTG